MIMNFGDVDFVQELAPTHY